MNVVLYEKMGFIFRFGVCGLKEIQLCYFSVIVFVISPHSEIRDSFGFEFVWPERSLEICDDRRSMNLKSYSILSAGL